MAAESGCGSGIAASAGPRRGDAAAGRTGAAGDRAGAGQAGPGGGTKRCSGRGHAKPTAGDGCSDLAMTSTKAGRRPREPAATAKGAGAASFLALTQGSVQRGGAGAGRSRGGDSTTVSMGRLRPSPGRKAAAASPLGVPPAGHCGVLAGIGRAGVSDAGSIIEPRRIGGAGSSAVAWSGAAGSREPSRLVMNAGADDGGGAEIGSGIGREMGSGCGV